MEVMNLATKEKQDEILSNFPISGGTDFSEYTPHMFYGKTRAINETLFNISGEGILSSISIMLDSNNSRTIEIRVDDEDFFTFNGLDIGTGNNVSHVFVPMLRFNTSLEIKGSGGTSLSLETRVVGTVLLK